LLDVHIAVVKFLFFVVEQFGLVGDEIVVFEEDALVLVMDVDHELTVTVIFVFGRELPVEEGSLVSAEELAAGVSAVKVPALVHTVMGTAHNDANSKDQDCSHGNEEWVVGFDDNVFVLGDTKLGKGLSGHNLQESVGVLALLAKSLNSDDQNQSCIGGILEHVVTSLCESV
jgi:hypothetical protein